MLSEKSQWTQNVTMFVDLDWPLNTSSPLSASADLLVMKRHDLWWLPNGWFLQKHRVHVCSNATNCMSYHCDRLLGCVELWSRLSVICCCRLSCWQTRNAFKTCKVGCITELKHHISDRYLLFQFYIGTRWHYGSVTPLKRARIMWAVSQNWNSRYLKDDIT